MHQRTWSSVCVYYHSHALVAVGWLVAAETRRMRESVRWNESLTFDICLGNIPREARVCFTIYSERKGTRQPIAWVAHRLFDFALVFHQGVKYVGLHCIALHCIALHCIELT
jgi:hypothetical protein